MEIPKMFRARREMSPGHGIDRKVLTAFRGGPILSLDFLGWKAFEEKETGNRHGLEDTENVV